VRDLRIYDPNRPKPSIPQVQYRRIQSRQGDRHQGKRTRLQHVEGKSMSTTNDGGPAFPHESIVLRATDNAVAASAVFNGMTLRDYFAAKALQGMMADSQCVSTADDFARSSYALADAMLSARAQGGKEGA
jgi:hypothetical protein